MVFASNGEQYGVHVETCPYLEDFWLDTFQENVRPNKPELKICLAFPFEVALRLSNTTLTKLLKENFSIITVYNENTLDFFNSEQIRVPARTANEIIQQLRDRKAELLLNKI